MTTYAQIATGYHLAKPAADSYFRMQAQGMPAGGINSAYRSHASQRALFLDRYTPRAAPNKGPYGDVRWYQGKRYVRISPKGSVAVPGSSKSRHESGLALDIATASSAHAWIKKYGRSHGWVADVPGEPWHFEYRANLDQYKNTKPTPSEEDMPTPRSYTRNKPQTLVKNRWNTVRITNSDGVSTAMGPALVETQLVLSMLAPAGSRIRVRAYKVNYSTKTRTYTYDAESKTDSQLSTGNAHHFDVTAMGRLHANERLRFEAYTWSDGVKITQASSRTKEWK